MRLTPEKLQAASDEMAETLRAIESLEAAKKAMASDYKGKIEKNKQRLRELTETIQSKEEASGCRGQWIFECRGINDTGAIEDPEYKTLQRLDTLAAVTTMKITDADRQTALLSPAPTRWTTASTTIRKQRSWTAHRKRKPPDPLSNRQPWPAAVPRAAGLPHPMIAKTARPAIQTATCGSQTTESSFDSLRWMRRRGTAL